ncbi:LamG-like jellyroll fold domain-containing protein [Streptomyces sp. WMMB 322]|uniref:LamG-like jellyroll fold domain-containing protein n=1 Tax=Streptomyces sp. WMMB 322 TaxID=1286821 RepID=UPI0006E2413D|nr:LamG-like jellyroll fold domain-containing protein [Streptomyces sp. WMMB 322]SCK30835.1 Concanavalin A-like lectin/glucanases superfamily protein [Streptomyces sp. WMMB 322]
MVFTRLSDDELRRLAQEEGERTSGAREELEQRHYQAVRAFAYVVSPAAGDELAGRAWEQALRPLDEDITGAMRPRALAAVLRTGAEWLRGGRRSELAPGLVDWFEEAAGDGVDAAADGDAGSARLTDQRSSSLTAQTFERLPARSQTVLWHHEVEHDDAAAVHQLLATGTEDVSLLNRRARREFYTTYVSLHQNATVDDACRRLHRMLLAYAEQTSMNTPGDLVAHLDRCEHCARAVDDLERMRFEFGSVLAEAMLPWGGADYALAAHTVSSETLDVTGTPGAEPGRGAGAGARVWASAAGPGRRVLGVLRARASALPGTAALLGGERSPRARRFALTAALVGLCSLVVAVAYTGGLRQGAQNGAGPRPGTTSGPPAPSGRAEPTATATSTVTATKPPGNPGKGGKPSSPVRGAALEWLFDAVGDGTTADTSGNGVGGTLDGDPLPETARSGLEFFGEQSVVADGPVVDTSGSFSVSARARMNDTEDFQTVVSQDAENISGFSLQYDPEADRWEMIMPEEDEEDADLVQAGSSRGAEPDRWTYLTGVYDAGAGEIRLYIDGHLEDTADVEQGSGFVDGFSTTTTTSTTTSGGGDGFDGFGSDGNGNGNGYDSSGNSNGTGNGSRFDGGSWDFSGDADSGEAAGGYFGGASQNYGNSDAERAADEIIRRVTGGRHQVVDADGDFAVGRALGGEEFVRGFDGVIDDVRAFKRALSASEAAALAGR